MIFKWNDDGWRRRFAFFPIYLSNGPEKQVVWLQWHWRKFMGLYTEISIDDPRKVED